MKYYESLVNLGCFTRDDVEAMTGNRETAHSVIESYKKRGWVESVRRDLFVTISFETKQPVPSRYAIASHAAPGAYVFGHTAFEYHGLANQVYYELYVASQSRFRNFTHDGITYIYVPSLFRDGVESKPDGTRVTNMERTVVDGIDDFERAGGLEELLRCIGMMPYLDPLRLNSYLQNYGKPFLFHKAGYILEHFRDDLKLPEDFFTACRNQTINGRRYLYTSLKEEPHLWDERWALYAPERLMALTRKGAVYHE